MSKTHQFQLCMSLVFHFYTDKKTWPFGELADQVPCRQATGQTPGDVAMESNW